MGHALHLVISNPLPYLSGYGPRDERQAREDLGAGEAADVVLFHLVSLHDCCMIADLELLARGPKVAARGGRCDALSAMLWVESWVHSNGAGEYEARAALISKKVQGKSFIHVRLDLPRKAH
jgi:hypothetical protein